MDAPVSNSAHNDAPIGSLGWLRYELNKLLAMAHLHGHTVTVQPVDEGHAVQVLSRPAPEPVQAPAEAAIAQAATTEVAIGESAETAPETAQAQPEAAAAEAAEQPAEPVVDTPTA